MQNRTAYIDFDGTIVDVFPRYFKIIQEYMINNFNLRLPYGIFVYRKRTGKKEHEIIREHCQRDIDIEDYVMFKRERLENKEYLKEDRIIDNPQLAYEKLKKEGYHVKLLSQRRNAENLRWEIGYLNIKNCFDSITVVEPTSNNAKLEYLKNIVNKDDIIIGDSPLDMECAEELNIKGYFVESGLYNSDVFSCEIRKAADYNAVVSKYIVIKEKKF